MKIIIVGGVAGGASAAARARRISEKAEIVILERGEYISFANCGLPYHIGGDISSRDDLLLQTPESFKARFNVDVRTLHDVISINRENKFVEVKNLHTGELYKESYDKLLLSPGAAPIKPSISGIDHPRVLSLRNITDMDKIIAIIQSQKVKHATVVGGGFIGLEMVEAMHQRHIQVTQLELSEQVMAPIDAEMATVIHDILYNKSIDLRLKTGLVGITDIINSKVKSTHALQLTLSTQDIISTDIVILAIGVKPETLLASQSGIALGSLGGIKVNSLMQTSDPDIYAVGDVVEIKNFVTQTPSLIPLAGPANRQARIAADNMLGKNEVYQNTQGTSICKIFEWAVASTGLNEKTLKKLGLRYQKIYVHTASHASYYPNSSPINLKLLFSPDNGKILGAQVIGIDGIDKRIDVLAVAQRAGLTVKDLVHLELSYAPPFGSARDVINQAGMVATNVLQQESAICHAEELLINGEEKLILDVRNTNELTMSGQLPNAINIPLHELRQRLNELPRDQEIIIACQVGLRGYVAYRMLMQHGFYVRNLNGGYKTYCAVKSSLLSKN